jgi:Ca-activated chloride channel family protein
MAPVRNVFSRNVLNKIAALSCKIAALSCALLLAGFLSQAQTPQAQQSSSQSEQERAAVKLDVIITDEKDHFVSDVRREDVRVTEDGVAQTVTAFELEERPVNYGLMLDTTGSMRSILDEIVSTGRAVVNANRPGDKAFVMHYVGADTIEFDTGLTSDKAALEEAFDDLFIQGGLTATLDALHRALDFTARSRTNVDDKGRRHALVIITDGEDRGSQQSNPETLFARLRQSDVQVFIIGLTKMADVRNRDKAAALLNGIARESGGRAFFPKSFAEMPGVIQELTHDLHTQYAIGYNPTNAAHDGSFRKVQVTLPTTMKGKRSVITRAGYTATR